jgi:hypothetical protein
MEAIMNLRYFGSVMFFAIFVVNSLPAKAACETATKACYLETRKEIIDDTRALLQVVQQHEDLTNQFIAGRRHPLDAQERAVLQSLQAARETFHKVTLPKYQLMQQKLSFWGFAYKSAAQMEMTHRRLEWCFDLAVLAKYTLRDYLNLDGSRENATEFLQGATSYVLRQVECARAAGIPSGNMSGPIRKLVARAVAECGKTGSGHICSEVQHIEETLQLYGATKNADYARLPGE